MKNFKSSKVKTRLKNYINKKVFNLEFDEVPNYIRCIHTSKEEIESENIITSHTGTLPGKKEKEGKERLFIGEELKWITDNLVQRFEM